LCDISCFSNACAAVSPRNIFSLFKFLNFQPFGVLFGERADFRTRARRGRPLPPIVRSAVPACRARSRAPCILFNLASLQAAQPSWSPPLALSRARVLRVRVLAPRGGRGGSEGAREGARERGSEGARERGSEGARERGSEGGSERASEEGRAGSTGYSKPVRPCVLLSLCSPLLSSLVRSKLQPLAASSLLDVKARVLWDHTTVQVL
jgi:hypothetical protein